MSAARQVIKIDGTFFSLDKLLDLGMSGKIFHGTNLDTNEAVAIKKFEFDHHEFEASKENTIAAVKTALEESITPIRERLTELQTQFEQDLSQSIQSEIAALKEKLERGNAFLPAHIEKAVRNSLQEKIDAMRIGVLHESDMLKQVGDGIGSVAVHGETSDPTTTVYYLAMKLAPGEKVTDLLRKQADANVSVKLLSLDVLFDIGLQLGLSLSRVQMTNVVLRDIHFNNVIYDLQTKRLTLVDYGDALKLAHGGVAVGYAMGSEPFMAPEILDGLDKRRHSVANMEYSEKTTVFSYGAMLANLFDLADIRDSQFLKTEKVRFKTIILRDSDTQLSKLADADIRQKMLELIKEMTTKNPDRRISLRNATERLYAIMSKYKSENAKVIEHPKKRARHVRATNISQFPFMLFKKESDAALLQTPTFPNTIAMHFVTPPEPTMPHLVSQGRKRSR